MNYTRKFDLILSLGGVCSCTQMLRRANLQVNSYPLDWVSGGNIAQRVNLFLSGFDSFLNMGDLEKIGEASSTGCDVYFNNRTQLRLPHDFAFGRPLEETYPGVNEKYQRRIQRLAEKVESASSILFVYMEPPLTDLPHPSNDEIASAFRKIREKYPDKDVKLCYITYNPDMQQATLAKEMIGDDIIHYVSEYKSRKKNARDYSVEHAVCRRFVREFSLKQPFMRRVKDTIIRAGRYLIPFHGLRKQYSRRFHIYHN